MPQSPKESPYLTVEEAAEFLRLTVRTLENYRWNGGGPHYHKHGTRVLYHMDDLEEWSTERRYRSTSEKSKKKPKDK